RGTLFFEIEKILYEKRPKAFLLENVKNLKSHDKGRTFKVIKTILEKLDYKVYETTFKSRDFGVPQNRERIYIVGFDKRQLKYTDFDFPSPPCIQTKLGEILEENEIGRASCRERV